MAGEKTGGLSVCVASKNNIKANKANKANLTFLAFGPRRPITPP